MASALFLGFEPGAAGDYTFEELRLAVEAANLRRQHEREERAALAAQSVHTLAYYLGLPHIAKGEARNWANSLPSPRELYEVWAGAGSGEEQEEGSRANNEVKRPGFREGRPRTVETILEDLKAWGVDAADYGAWTPSASIELLAFRRAREVKEEGMD